MFTFSFSASVVINNCYKLFIFSTSQEGYSKLSGDIAGDRKFDVYMGIDVFGRNTYGGGEWNVSTFLQQTPFFCVSISC